MNYELWHGVTVIFVLGYSISGVLISHGQKQYLNFISTTMLFRVPCTESSVG